MTRVMMKGGKKRPTANTGPGDPASHEDIGTPGNRANLMKIMITMKTRSLGTPLEPG